MNKLLITGGAGFIGINFVKHMRNHGVTDILIVDKMGYASNQDELDAMGVHYEVIDIANKTDVELLFSKYKISHIVHFAAESHVDNSIKDSSPFIQSNVVGTVNLLDQSVKHKIEKFVHISTDEVFGEVPYPGKFNEHSNICPRNPYSASKAAAEHFVVSYGNTHNLPYVIINSSNNYGPFQHPEKLIPLTISRILKKEKIPVYGQGEQIRDWIYVEDTCIAIEKILMSGVIGNRYCIGGDSEIKNIELVRNILTKMNADTNLIEFVADRPGHDVRYATDISKVKKELNWRPLINVSLGLDKTIEWITKYENRI
jgi:dTDP-glucose 4,6-dehydratase